MECQSLEEALEAAKAGADIVMLDNFTPQTIHVTARQIKEIYPHILIEASGGISEETMQDYMSEYVDIISRGSLTQGICLSPTLLDTLICSCYSLIGYACADFSLKVIPPNKQ